MRVLAVMAVALTLLAGCVTYGKAADETITDQWQIGTTTLEQVKAQLGKPEQVVDLGKNRVRYE